MFFLPLGHSIVLTHSLLSRFDDILVGLEERADVQGLTAPELTLDGPVEGELQTAAVE